MAPITAMALSDFQLTLAVTLQPTAAQANCL
jgi:hypothetical protein